MHLPDDPEQLPQAPHLDVITSFAQLRTEGFCPFTLGPLYVYANVHFSLIDAFLRDDRQVRPPDTRGGRFIFDRSVVARCEQWNYVVEVMDVASYRAFKMWLPTNHFVDRPGKRFCVARQFPTPVLDPLVMSLKGDRVPEVLDVFTISSNRVLLRPICEQTYDSVSACVDFQRSPPEAEVLVLAEATLT